MSKFNSAKVSSTATTNLAGGSAYKESAKLELASLLVTSFLSGDKAYEKEADTIKRLEKLYEKMNTEDKKFFAQAAIYARDKFRLRSISHLCASLIGEGISAGNYDKEDKAWIANFFSKVVMRGDDITEIISAYKSRPNCYKSKKGRIQIPEAMKSGLSKALGRMDEYQLAKYRGSNKETSLIDAVRMLHAKATDKNKTGLEKLVKGTLRSTETWEAKQSAAGQVAADVTDKEEKAKAVAQAQSEAWEDFVNKGDKIEYMALLRNLRNIEEKASEETFKKALAIIRDPKKVLSSKQLPFRFLTAMKQMMHSRAAVSALSDALEISVSNCPELPGKTAILVDISGSMSTKCSSVGCASVSEVAGIFAASLYKKNEDAEIVLFGSKGWYLKANPKDSIETIAENCHCRYAWTCMGAGFEILNRAYDRIIVLSDMQSWVDPQYAKDTKDAFRKYAKKYNPNVKLYSFDLAGMGTLQFPERNVFTIAGLSEHVFDIMAKMEEDKRYMIHEIEAIEL